MKNTKKDRRKINKKWTATNKLGETFEYGLLGSGKNSIVVTLNYLGKNLKTT